LDYNQTFVNYTLSQQLPARQNYNQTVYQSNFVWLAGSLRVMTLAFFAITVTLNGWWHLRRNIGMSPLEIVKAFDAPLMLQADDNGEIKDLLATAGECRVQYGAASNTSKSGGLLIIDEDASLDAYSDHEMASLGSITCVSNYTSQKKALWTGHARDRCFGEWTNLAQSPYLRSIL
jgi:hypothetical protein